MSTALSSWRFPWSMPRRATVFALATTVGALLGFWLTSRGGFGDPEQNRALWAYFYVLQVILAALSVCVVFLNSQLPSWAAWAMGVTYIPCTSFFLDSTAFYLDRSPLFQVLLAVSVVGSFASCILEKRRSAYVFFCLLGALCAFLHLADGGHV